MLICEMKKLATSVNPSGFTDYRQYLQKVYDTIKGAVKKYSYIAFTSLCGLGETNAMYLFIHADRPLTPKTARRIATSLGLKGEERGYFLKLVEYQHARKSEDRNDAFQGLLAIKARCLTGDWDRQNLDFFNQWYHSAIYEMLRLDGVKDDAAWIAANLKPAIAPSKVEESLALLQKLQLVQYDEELGRLAPTKANISTGSEIRGMVFKSYHNQMINLALAALSQERAGNRDISSVTIGVSLAAMEKIKELSAKFRQDLLQLADGMQDKEQILQVNVQIFPLTSEIKDKKND